MWVLLNIIFVLFTIVTLLVAVAFFTLAERKIMAGIQHRRGPNVVGFWGLLQPFADGLKLIAKEIVIPRKSNGILFILAPIITLFLSLSGWCVIPYNYNNVICDVRLGILFVLLVNSLGIYGILISGWSSNSKYAFLGSFASGILLFIVLLVTYILQIYDDMCIVLLIFILCLI